MEKAKLKWTTEVPKGGSVLECQFKPSELKIVKQNTWTPETWKNWNAPRLKFSGGLPATYSLALFFQFL